LDAAIEVWIATIRAQHGKVSVACSLNGNDLSVDIDVSLALVVVQKGLTFGKREVRVEVDVDDVSSEVTRSLGWGVE
jgi:hypothetical protein